MYIRLALRKLDAGLFIFRKEVTLLRTLKFIVDGQNLKPDPSCDFRGLVPGTEKYLVLEFSFSPDWSDTVRVAAFYSSLGVEYKPQALLYGTTCTVPAEALRRRSFKVQVVGKDAHGAKIVTNKVVINQDGGNT